MSSLLKSAAPILRTSSTAFRQLRLASVAAPQQYEAPTLESDYTVKILAAANARTFANAFRYAAHMREGRISPSISVYNALMRLAAMEGQWLFSWAIFDDMSRANVPPTKTTYAHLLQAQRTRNYTNFWAAYSETIDSGVAFNSAIATAILENHISQGNIENALQFLLNMKQRNIIPELPAIQDTIALAANCGYSRLAIELASFFEQETLRRMDESVWLTCLASAAQNYYASAEGVISCWRKLINDLEILPDEGAALAVLNTAARHGLPDLATDVLRILKLLGVSWQEHHFAALIEAFGRNGQLKEAFVTLDIMQTNDIEVISTTARPIVDIIGCDADSLDNAWDVLDEIHSSSNNLNLEAVKIVLEASLNIGDLQRAMGIYKALSDFSLQPDILFFNMLLKGCVAASHRQLGDVLLDDIKQTGLEPDPMTFELMIRLCLTQEVYEDAFYYLEEMKAAGFIPREKVYTALIEKCESVQDSRMPMVLDEMKECGFRIPLNFRPPQWNPDTNRQKGRDIRDGNRRDRSKQAERGHR